jgi:hypothetical protein
MRSLLLFLGIALSLFLFLSPALSQYNRVEADEESAAPAVGEGLRSQPVDERMNAMAEPKNKEKLSRAEEPLQDDLYDEEDQMSARNDQFRAQQW